MFLRNFKFFAGIGFASGLGLYLFNPSKKIPSTTNIELASTNNDNSSALAFTRIPIFSFYSREINPQKKDIDIVLQQRTLNELPYNDVGLLNPDKNRKLQKFRIKRESCDRVVFRGDNRDIKKICEVGGFHPTYTMHEQEYGYDRYEYNRYPLDIELHRCLGDFKSGFVSTTIRPHVAHEYGCWFAERSGKNKTYTVYAVNAIGAMTPSPKTPDKDLMEFSIPGGVDAEDIIAYRECHQTKLIAFTGFYEEAPKIIVWTLPFTNRLQKSQNEGCKTFIQ